ncbi:DUF4097 family beta strand repeat-containing protein [Streptomyces erythrochromogenes]|uniref:DUF4097 family beta strand repeat-containing protein n=1 Tax=Streptomyces erythrochromogenes TaxID=285574 RepID=UPI00369086F5
MPIFDTPAPISVVLNLMLGQVRIVASDRTESTVEAFPRDSDDQDDVQAAEQLRIEYVGGRLLVNIPKPGGSGGAVILVIAVPTGSSLRGRGVAADFLAVGKLGECHLHTGLGHIRLDRTGSLRLSASFGDITVDQAAGNVEVMANCGDVHLGQVEGRTTVRAMGDGSATVGEVRGAARLHTDRGAIRIGRAHIGVEARTTQGDIDIEEVARGAVLATTTYGSIRIGVAEPSNASLSLDSGAGTVYTSLSLLAAQMEADEAVRVEARTVIGNVVVERSPSE